MGTGSKVVGGMGQEKRWARVARLLGGGHGTGEEMGTGSKVVGGGMGQEKRWARVARLLGAWDRRRDGHG